MELLVLVHSWFSARIFPRPGRRRRSSLSSKTPFPLGPRSDTRFHLARNSCLFLYYFTFFLAIPPTFVHKHLTLGSFVGQLASKESIVDDKQQRYHGILEHGHSNRLGLVAEENQSETSAQRRAPRHGGNTTTGSGALSVLGRPVSRSKWVSALSGGMARYSHIYSCGPGACVTRSFLIEFVLWHCSSSHVGQSGTQRELGSRCQGRHGNDAQQNHSRGHAVQA